MASRTSSDDAFVKSHFTRAYRAVRAVVVEHIDKDEGGNKIFPEQIEIATIARRNKKLVVQFISRTQSGIDSTRLLRQNGGSLIQGFIERLKIKNKKYKDFKVKLRELKELESLVKTGERGSLASGRPSDFFKVLRESNIFKKRRNMGV